MESSLDVDISHFVEFCSNYDYNSFRHHDIIRRSRKNMQGLIPLNILASIKF